MKKKLAAFLLGAVLVLQLAACGGGQQAGTPESEKASSADVIDAPADAEPEEEDEEVEPEVANTAITGDGEFDFTPTQFYDGFELEEQTGRLSGSYDGYTLTKVEYVGGDIHCYTLPGSENVSAIVLSVNKISNDLWAKNYIIAADYILAMCGLDFDFRTLVTDEIIMVQDVPQTEEMDGVTVTFTSQEQSESYVGGVLAVRPANGALDTAGLEQEIVREDDFMLADDYKTRLYEYTREFDYANAITILDEYIENEDPAENDTVFIFRELAEQLAELTPYVHFVPDEFAIFEEVYYTGVEAISGSISLLPRLENRYKKLEIEVGFAKANWLFFEKVEIRAGDAYITQNFSYTSVNREMLGGADIMEYITWDLDDEQIESIINAEEPPIMRFTGENDNTYDHTISQSEIDALRTLYEIQNLRSEWAATERAWRDGLLD